MNTQLSGQSKIVRNLHNDSLTVSTVLLLLLTCLVPSLLYANPSNDLNIISNDAPQEQTQPESNEPPQLQPKFVEDPGGTRTIKVGDVIRVELTGEDWGGQFQIPSTGEIDFKFLNRIKVIDKTLGQLKSELKRKLRPYYINPELTVNYVNRVEEGGPPPIYFGGFINNKGAIQVDGPVSFAKAVSMAGGFMEEALPEKIRISRSGYVPTEDEIIIVNGLKLQDPSKNYGENSVTLYPGDYVYVPRRKLEEKKRIHIGGAVKKPQASTLDDSIPFGVAISNLAGGLDSKADLSKVYVAHENGETTTINGERQMKLGKLSPDDRYYVHPGDYIYVPNEEQKKIDVKILGAVGKPQKLTLNSGEGVIDAVLKAGSLKKQGDRWKTFIFRKHDDGDTELLTASYSKYVQGNLEQNIALTEGDVIYVKTRFWPYFDTLNDVLRTIGYVTGAAVNIDRLERVQD